ncbi:uncharacterized protein si:dkey-112e17.1 [Thalassophryne amazonica]|uniref:uncharacterized protein si:dkey-112e17.1 n=1 Tax=Thalassophryne amazonica TaxID=390379 RepID=UPI001470FE48|nr:uncharacterized protein si:dkey-112e17.1 [Thalassophryne amazonica]
MSFATSLGTQVFITAYLLFVMGCVAQKVYFDCGAKVDVSDVQGLILSPGFPSNYSSGTHCVWQFFVPVNYQIILEIFDFDVFESQESTAEYTAIGNGEEEARGEEMFFKPGSLMVEGTKPTPEGPVNQSDGAQTQQASQDGFLPGVVHPGHKNANSVSSFHLREDLNLSPDTHQAMEETAVASLQPTNTPEASTEAQQSGLDTCPHDVLYISDLITFSSRFCGSNRPPNNQLVFGSSHEMVEVIMELITTTHWGRGFAILFHYHNLTEPGGHKHVFTATTNKVGSLLAAVSGAAILTMILTSAVCIVFRQNLCPKRSSSCPATNSEVPERVQNAGVDVSELQLITDNQTNLELTVERENQTGGAVSDISQNAELKLSSSALTELDIGADDAFTALSAPSPSRTLLSSHTQWDRFLRHSDTGSNPAGDWASPDCTAAPPGATSGIRPRAWSVRTFQDLIPPIPQLHKKWCSWNSSSPFTKLVDSVSTTTITPNAYKEHSHGFTFNLSALTSKEKIIYFQNEFIVTGSVPERVQNAGVDVSELQLITDNQTNLELTVERENQTGGAVSDISQNAELKLSSSALTELDIGADDAFTALSAPSPSRTLLSSHTQWDRFLRHSDTGSNPAGDWASPDCTAAPPGATSGIRPRAWSVRTFQDLIPPIPQLHKKWCSWNSSSPFTKLVDSAPSSLVVDGRGGDTRKVFSDVHLASKAGSSPICDSSHSSASYPLAQPAQRQRRLNSTSNLRRSLFTGPCFGLLSGMTNSTKASGTSHDRVAFSEGTSGSSSCPQGQGEGVQPRKKSDFSGEEDHISMPVFAICEEEDRQPLVQAEHQGQDSSSAVLNRPVSGSYEQNRMAAGSASLSLHGPRTEWESWGNQASRVVTPQPTISPTIYGLNPAFSDGSDTQLSLNKSAESYTLTKQM